MSARSATTAGATSTTRAGWRVEAHFGDKVETTYEESVPEGADAERVIRQLALSGAPLIFTTSFGFMDATINVARQFPDVKFEHATGVQARARTSPPTPRASTRGAR